MITITINMLIEMKDWFSKHMFEVVSFLVQGFIAYHIFFLSKKISNRDKLSHKEQIKQKAENIKQGSKIYLVNINRYFKDYPDNADKLLGGYSHIKAEYKCARFDGIEFFCSTPEQVYKKEDGTLSFQGLETEKDFIVFPVGIVPYEWIEYIDLEGDEYAYVPLFYSRFKGKIYWKNFWRRLIPFGYPYNKLAYYRESDVYDPKNDPDGMKYTFVRENIAR